MDIKNWTIEEFKAYLLIYASQSNFNESEEQVDTIESKFDNQMIDKIKKEIKILNDYDRISLVTDYIKLNKISQNELDSILIEIKDIYKADGYFDSVEKSIFIMLEKLLKV